MRRRRWEERAKRMVGTVGGKVGLLAGIGAMMLLVEPIISLLAMDCFFEAGCGPNEMWWVAATATTTVVVGLSIGLAVRAITNVCSIRGLKGEQRAQP